jgi:hypothetical protein
MGRKADRPAEPVGLTPAEAGRRAANRPLSEVDIRAILAAAGDDPVFAQLDQAKVCALLVKARRSLSIFGGVAPDFGIERKRARDPASSAMSKHLEAADKAFLAMMGMQERTFHKWAQLDEMERLMTEVGATATLYDNCPNRALMGRLMAFVVGKAVGSSALKGRMARRRRFSE